MTLSLWRVMLRHISRRPIQSVLFIIGVMIGVAMMVAVDMANFSATRAFELSADSVAGRATHQIIGGPNGIDEAVYVQIKTDFGLREAAPIVEDFVVANALDERPLRLLGVDAFAEPPFRNYLTADDTDSLTEYGRLLIEPNTILIGERLANTYDLNTNDNIRVRYGETEIDLTIVAILQSEDELTARALEGILVTDIATAQEVLGRVGVLSRIDLLIQDNDALLDQIRDVVPSDATLEVPEARREALSEITAAFQLNLTALSLLALVVGMFLIYNTVTFSVVQRRAVLGTLRSLGVTRQQIFRLVVWEAALLSTVGAVLGLALGIILGRAAVTVVTQTVNDLYFTTSVRTVEIPAFSLVKGILIGVGAAIFAALLPAYEATTTPPAGAARRSELERRTRQLLPYLSAIGIGMAIVGAAMLVVQNVVISIAALFVMLIGFALLTPVVTIAAMQVFRPVTAALGGVLGRMAPQSIVRSLSRTSVAIAALMVATSTIVGVSVMVGSFRITVEDWLGTTFSSDIFIAPPIRTFSDQQTSLPPEVAETVAEVPGTAQLHLLRRVDLTSPDLALPIYTAAVDTDISDGQRTFIEMRYNTQAEVWDGLFNGAGVLLTESFAHNRDITWSDDLTLPLATENGIVEFEVLGIYQDFSTSTGNILIGLGTYRDLWNDPTISSIAVDVESGFERDGVIGDLQDALAGRELVVQSNNELLAGALDIFDRTFAITTALNLLATFVAFVGILSALLALQLERQREIGIMRSNGLTRGQLWRLTMWETGLMGTMAGMMAMPIGLLLATVLTYIINQRSFGWTLEMNLRAEFFAQAFVVAIVAALLAGLYPAYAMGRIAPARALRAE